MANKIVQKVKNRVKNRLAVPDPVIKAQDPGTTTTSPSDHDYRYPYWEVLLGEFSLTKNPPAYLQELVVTMRDESTASYTMKLFDESWVTIPTVLGYGQAVAEAAKKDILVGVSFGWPIPNKKIEGLIGSLLQVKESVTPDGMEYTLNGQFWTYPVAGQEGASALVMASPYMRAIKSPLPRSYPPMRVSALVQEICDRLGMVDPIIEETRDLGQNSWTLPSIPISLFLSRLAYHARPLEFYLGQKDTGFTSSLLEQYRSYWDIQGRYHFHSLGYIQGQGQAKEYFYPYPREENPVQNLTFADLDWAPQTIAGAFVDPVTGDQISVEGPAGGSHIRLMSQHLNSKDFVEHAQQAQKRLSVQSYDADLTVLGDISIRPQDRVFITVTPPKRSEEAVLSHLSGIYMVKDVVHTINSDGFITGFAATKQHKKHDDTITVQGTSVEEAEENEDVQHAAGFGVTGSDAEKGSAKAEIDAHLDSLKSLKVVIQDCVKKHGLDTRFPNHDMVAVVGAMASRESNAGDSLDSGGRGDSGHGHGIMQIDDRSHAAWIRKNDWQDPATNICRGTEIFKDNIVRRNIENPEHAIRVGLNEYNTGGSAYTEYRNNNNTPIDTGTEGNNYGKDTLLRAEYLKKTW
jgi:hypothetical protein